MPVISPFEILAHHPPEFIDRSLRQPECRTEHDVVAVVQDALIVAKLEVVDPDRGAISLFSQDVGGLEDLLDKYGPLANSRLVGLPSIPRSVVACPVVIYHHSN